MQSLFFRAEAFDQEIIRKFESRKTNPLTLMEALIVHLNQKGMSAEDLEKLSELFSQFLQNMPLNQKTPHYLTHPIRVAASWADYLESPDYENMALALCHNLMEVSPEVLPGLPSDYLSKENRQFIEVLTIDRDQEKDKSYLKKYYDGIEREGLMLLKAMDKLDNTFGWVLANLEAYHSEIIFEEVCPRVSRTHRKLGEYLRQLTSFVLEPENKDHFRRTIHKS